MTVNIFLAEELHDPTNHDNPIPATTTQAAKTAMHSIYSGEDPSNPNRNPGEGQSEISAQRQPGEATQTVKQQSWPADGPNRPDTTGILTDDNGEIFTATAVTRTASIRTGDGDERDGHASSQFTLSVPTATAPTTVDATATGAGTGTSDSRDADDDGDSGGGGGGGGAGGLSDTNKKIAIAVPVAVVGALIIAALIFFLLKRRKRNQRRSKSVMTGSPSQTEMNLAPASALSLPHQQHDSWTSTPNHDPGNVPPPPITITPLPTRRAAPVPVPVPVPQVQVQDHDALTSHSRNVSSDTGRMQSRFTEHEHLEGAQTGAPVVLAAAAAAAGAGAAAVGSAAVMAGHGHGRSSSMDRPGSKSSEERPQSPFAHPLDDDADAMSDISEMSGRRSTGRERGQDHDDDVSSVSSFEDDEHHLSQRRVGNS